MLTKREERTLPNEERAPDPWRRTFESHPEFDVVLLDGERWHCHLLQWSTDALLVESGRGQYLVPRHAIKYIVVDEQAEEVLERAAAEVPALQEFLERGDEPHSDPAEAP
jgi:sRNA-binding regulator protein Hfq